MEAVVGVHADVGAAVRRVVVEARGGAVFLAQGVVGGRAGHDRGVAGQLQELCGQGAGGRRAAGNEHSGVVVAAAVHHRQLADGGEPQADRTCLGEVHGVGHAAGATLLGQRELGKGTSFALVRGVWAEGGREDAVAHQEPRHALAQPGDRAGEVGGVVDRLVGIAWVESDGVNADKQHAAWRDGNWGVLGEAVATARVGAHKISRSVWHCD